MFKFFTLVALILGLMAAQLSLVDAYDYCGNDYYCSSGYCCRGGYYCCTYIYSYWWFWLIDVAVLVCCIGCCVACCKKNRRPGMQTAMPGAATTVQFSQNAQYPQYPQSTQQYYPSNAQYPNSSYPENSGLPTYDKLEFKTNQQNNF